MSKLYLKPIIDQIKYFKNKQEMALVVQGEFVETIDIGSVFNFFDPILKNDALVGVIYKSNKTSWWGGLTYMANKTRISFSDEQCYSKMEAAIHLRNLLNKKVYDHEIFELDPIKKLEDMLSKHDWYYQHSDDNSYFLAGEKSMYEIQSLMKLVPEDIATHLYNKYSK